MHYTSPAPRARMVTKAFPEPQQCSGDASSRANDSPANRPLVRPSAEPTSERYTADSVSAGAFIRRQETLQHCRSPGKDGSRLLAAVRCRTRECQLVPRADVHDASKSVVSISTLIPAS